MKWLARPFLGAMFGVVVATACSDPNIKGGGIGDGEDGGAGASNGGGGGAIGSGGKGGSSGAGTGGTGGPIVLPPAGDGGFVDPDDPNRPNNPIPGGGENECGRVSFKIERLPPEIVIALDRSTSMRSRDVPMSTNTRWEEMIPALSDAVKKTDAVVNWGLKVYPSTSGCGVSDPPEVPVTAMNATAVASYLSSAQPASEGTGTPTGAVVAKAVAILKKSTTKNPKFILLATDGEPTCDYNNQRPLPSSLASIKSAVAANIPVFVVGIASQKAELSSQLDMMAVEGGQPRMGTPKHYPVTTRQEFVDVLSKIAGQVSNCVFALDKVPPALDRVGITIGGMSVVSSKTDPVNGWSYGPNNMSIQLNGTACEKVKGGMLSSLDIVFGCPDDPIIP